MSIRPIFFVLAIITLPLVAQKTEFGIGLSVGHSNLSADRIQTEPNFTGVAVNGDWGFGLNIYAAVPVSGRLHFSTTPSILFQDQKVLFTPTGFPGTTFEEQIMGVSIVLPIRAELRAQSGNWRPVASAGIGALVDLTASTNERLSPEDLSAFWEVAVGLEKLTPHFKFRPEIFTRRGLGQVSRAVGDNIYNQALGNTMWSYVGFRILFYGNRRAKQITTK
ncbi:MAG: hypothetical protein AAFQ37_03945 [Bacteroidota bacterium]